MASSVHTHAKNLIITNDLDLVTDSGLKLMLATSGYTDDPDQDFIDDGGANDLIDHELAATGYSSGFGNRYGIDNPGTTVDDTDNEVEYDFDDEAFGALGNGTNETIGFVALVKEITNDAASVVVAVDDVANLLTNGSTVTYQVASEGMINF